MCAILLPFVVAVAGFLKAIFRGRPLLFSLSFAFLSFALPSFVQFVLCRSTVKTLSLLVTRLGSGGGRRGRRRRGLPAAGSHRTNLKGNDIHYRRRSSKVNR